MLFHPKDYIIPEAYESSSVPIAELVGLPELVQRSILQSDVDIRSALASNIVLVGGTSLIPGLSDRLLSELSMLIPSVSSSVSRNRNH
jgi:actin-related protein